MKSYNWYNRNTNIDSPDVIHQVLALGTLDDLIELKHKLSAEKLRDAFVNYPKKVYTPSTFNFIAKFLLNIDTQIDENKYLKTTPRNIG